MYHNAKSLVNKIEKVKDSLCIYLPQLPNGKKMKCKMIIKMIIEKNSSTELALAKGYFRISEVVFDFADALNQHILLSRNNEKKISFHNFRLKLVGTQLVTIAFKI